jgi:hypothetical protein
MIKRRDIIIIALLAVITFLLFFKVGTSYFSPAPAPASGAKPSVSDVKTMISSGMPEMNIIISLIKSGVPSDQAEQLVTQAKST